MLPLRDNVPTRAFPVVTVALILANVAVFVLYQLHDLAFHPCEVNGSCAQIDRGWPLAAFTSMFMHAGWLHLGGNMLFLWIFGNNVEDAMGRLRFLVFYLLGGFAATAVQTFVTLNWGRPGDALVPNLGASGAISAVLGAYLILFPRARVLTLVFYFFIELPAYFFLGFWIIFQLWQGGFSVIQAEGGGGVAFFAHIGGFAFGAATVKLFARRDRLQQ